MDLRTNKPSDYWTFGLTNLPTIGPSDYRTVTNNSIKYLNTMNKNLSPKNIEHIKKRRPLHKEIHVIYVLLCNSIFCSSRSAFGKVDSLSADKEIFLFLYETNVITWNFLLPISVLFYKHIAKYSDLFSYWNRMSSCVCKRFQTSVFWKAAQAKGTTFSRDREEEVQISSNGVDPICGETIKSLKRGN